MKSIWRWGRRWFGAKSRTITGTHIEDSFVLPLPEAPDLQPDAPSVVLDGLQDAGNVGTILRSAGAFGFRQVLAMKGTAALWSPKVLRALANLMRKPLPK